MAIEKPIFINTSDEQPIDDDGYIPNADKSRELPVQTDEKGNELFQTPPHGRTIEESYPGLFPVKNTDDYNPPR